jgi:hypothetical protein
MNIYKYLFTKDKKDISQETKNVKTKNVETVKVLRLSPTQSEDEKNIRRFVDIDKDIRRFVDIDYKDCYK